MKKSIISHVVASTLVAAAGLASAAPAARAQAASDPSANAAAARVIELAEKTHAAAQPVANKHLANGEVCRELMRKGKIPATATEQYKCILLGPAAAIAAAAHASQPLTY